MLRKASPGTSSSGAAAPAQVTVTGPECFAGAVIFALANQRTFPKAVIDSRASKNSGLLAAPSHPQLVTICALRRRTADVDLEGDTLSNASKSKRSGRLLSASSIPAI